MPKFSFVRSHPLPPSLLTACFLAKAGAFREGFSSASASSVLNFTLLTPYRVLPAHPAPNALPACPQLPAALPAAPTCLPRHKFLRPPLPAAGQGPRRGQPRGRARRATPGHGPPPAPPAAPLPGGDTRTRLPPRPRSPLPTHLIAEVTYPGADGIRSLSPAGGGANPPLRSARGRHFRAFKLVWRREGGGRRGEDGGGGRTEGGGRRPQ